MDTRCLYSRLNHFLDPSDRGFEGQTAIDPIKYTRAYYVDYCCDAGCFMLVAEPGLRLEYYSDELGSVEKSVTEGWRIAEDLGIKLRFTDSHRQAISD